MKRITFTKQLLAAALTVAIGFTGCQKNEMDEVNDTLKASSEELIIANACYTSLDAEVISTVKLKDKTSTDVVIANLEVGNNDEYLYVQITVPEDLETKDNKGITNVSFKIGGTPIVIDNQYYVDELRRQVLFEILRSDLGESGKSSVTITDITVSVKPLTNLTGSNGDYTGTFDDYTHNYQACQVLVCAHEKEYWKDANNAWTNFSKVDLGYSEAFLRSNLNSSANKNSVKLLQSITVASLNVANVDENAEGVAALKQAIQEAKALLSGVNVEAGQDMSGKITPGLIGRLHQIPACE